jgi:hypothetical protein
LRRHPGAETMNTDTALRDALAAALDAARAATKEPK